MTEILGTLIALGTIAAINTEAAGVITAAIGVVGVVGGAYLGADGYIKGKGAGNDPKPTV